MFEIICTLYIAIETEMSVRSLPVGGKFEQGAREALSEADIGTHLRRSSRIKVPSNINFESRTAERGNTLKNSRYQTSKKHSRNNGQLRKFGGSTMKSGFI